MLSFAFCMHFVSLSLNTRFMIIHFPTEKETDLWAEEDTQRECLERHSSTMTSRWFCFFFMISSWSPPLLLFYIWLWFVTCKSLLEKERRRWIIWLDSTTSSLERGLSFSFDCSSRHLYGNIIYIFPLSFLFAQTEMEANHTQPKLGYCWNKTAD